MQSPTQTEKAIMFVRWGQRASDILRSRVTSSTSWGEAVTVWVTASGHSAELGGVMRTSVWIDNHVQPGYGCAIWDERFLIDLSRHCVWCRRLAYGPSAVIVDAALTLYYTKAIIVPRRIICSWYTGRWWVDCYIWYREEGTGRDRRLPRPVLAVQNVTTDPSTISVPITVLLYSDPLLCCFSVPIEGLSWWAKWSCCMRLLHSECQCIKAWSSLSF